VSEHEKPTAFEQLLRLDKDLKKASRLIGRKEARALVDFYYQIQEFRKESGNQIDAAEPNEPNEILNWINKNANRWERDIVTALNIFTDEYKVSQWMKSITGIGPVLSAGFLARIDIREAPTAGHIWRFAGLDPTVEWLSKEKSEKFVKEVCGTINSEKVLDGQLLQIATNTGRTPESILKGVKFLQEIKKGKEGKDSDEDDKPGSSGGLDKTCSRRVVVSALSLRPWNAALKTLCFKAGDCFIKFQNHKNDYYGKLYVERKKYEQGRNDRGELKDQAALALEKKNYRKTTDAYKAYIEGKLPPNHIHMRSLRWTTKIFLSHLQTVMYQDYHKQEPPAPYAFTHCSGDHRHFINIPNWPYEGEGESLSKLLVD